MPTFNFTGSTQTYTVSAGVEEVIFELSGAGGAGGSSDNPADSSARGADGGYAKGTLTGLSGGETFTVYIAEGGNGGRDGGNTNTTGVWRYGGRGGYAVGATSNFSNGGGGGGASRVVRDSDGVDLLTAGGGGGGGSESAGNSTACGGGGGGRAGPGGTATSPTGDNGEDGVDGEGASGDGGSGGDGGEGGSGGTLTDGSTGGQSVHGDLINTTTTTGGGSSGTDGEQDGVTAADGGDAVLVVTEIDLVAPANTSATTVDESEITVTWDENGNDDEDGYEIEVSTDGGSNWSQAGTVAANTTSFSHTGLNNGEEYTYRVRAFTNNGSNGPWSNTDSAVTTLPDVAAPTLDNSTEDQMGVSWSDVTNYGNYRVQIRETGESSWTVSAAGFAETTVSEATTSHTFTGLEDGEEYEVRMRTETEHVNGSYTTPVSAITVLPAVTIDSTTDSAQNEITVTWTKNDDSPEGDYSIQFSTDGANFTEFSRIALGTTTETVTGLSKENKYWIRVQRDTVHTTTNAVDTQYTKPPVPTDLDVVEAATDNTYFVAWTDNAAAEDGYEILLDDGGFSQAGADLEPDTEFAHITEDESTNSGLNVRVQVFVGTGSERAEASADLTAPHTQNDGYRVVMEPPSGSADYYQTVRMLDPQVSLEYNAFHGGDVAIPSGLVDVQRDGYAEIFLYVNDERIIRGTVETIQVDRPTDGWTRLGLRGPMLTATRTQPSAAVTYTNITYTDAIRDYINNQQGGSITATVTDPPTNTTTDDAVVDDTDLFTSFSSLYTPADDEPVEVDGTGIYALQTSINRVEWEEWGGLWSQVTDGDTPGDIENYTNLEGARVEPGGSITATFTFDYDIPAERVGIRVRGDITSGGSATINMSFAGNDLGSHVPNVSWANWTSNYTGGDLQAGTQYTFSYSTGGGTEFDVLFDAINIYDTAHPPTNWDTSPNFGQVDGPENFPQDQTILLKDYPRPYNITEGQITVTANDTTNGQQLALSNDAGGTFFTADNASTFTKDFEAASQVGFTLQPRVTLSGFGASSWLTDRDEGQKITAVEIRLTTNDLPAIGADGVTVRQSDFANLRKLAQGGGLTMVADPGNMGESIEVQLATDPSVEKTLSDRILDESLQREMRDYANQVIIVYKDGATGQIEDFQNTNNSEVTRIGETVPITIFDASVTDQDEAREAADTEMRKRVSADETGGQITIPARVRLPGFAYTVSEWNLTPVLQRTVYTGTADNPRAELEFMSDTDVTRRVIDTESEIADIQQTITEN